MHFLCMFPIASLFLASSLATAQNPRPPELITSSGSRLGSAVATAGDLSTLVYSDYGAQELWLRTSDGRGIEWSAPVRIDVVPGVQETLSNDCLAIGEAETFF
jgi:hypothetical protein